MDRPETGHAPGSCCHKTKERAEAERKRLCNRLSRIEGQIRGIRGMVEKDAYCTDILVQSAAVNAAINAFNRDLLANISVPASPMISAREMTRSSTSWWRHCRS